MTVSREPIIEISAAGNSTKAEIYRNLQILYSTQAGEQALDRDFGIDVSIMDVPTEGAKALLTAEYVRKTEMYEPRAKVQRVEWLSGKEEQNLIPKVVVQLV